MAYGNGGIERFDEPPPIPPVGNPEKWKPKRLIDENPTPSVDNSVDGFANILNEIQSSCHIRRRNRPTI